MCPRYLIRDENPHTFHWFVKNNRQYWTIMTYPTWPFDSELHAILHQTTRPEPILMSVGWEVVIQKRRSNHVKPLFCLSLIKYGFGCQKTFFFPGFENKEFKSYSYSAMCVPSDVCSVDVVGATKGLKVGYSLVLQVLNRNYGDLQYAGGCIRKKKWVELFVPPKIFQKKFL